MSNVCSPGKCLCLVFGLIFQATGLYFPRLQYKTQVPSDWDVLMPIMPLHVINQSPGSLEFIVNCTSIFTECDSGASPESCEMPCTGRPFLDSNEQYLIYTGLPRLSNYAGHTFSLTVKAILTRQTDMYIEEATTTVLVTVDEAQSEQCSVCFGKNTEYFLAKGVAEGKRIATMKSFTEQRGCPHVRTFYDIDKDLPFEIAPTTGDLITTSIPAVDDLDLYTFNITCKAIGADQSNETQSLEIEVRMMDVDANGPSVPNGNVQLVAHITDSRDKGSIISVPGLQVFDSDITQIDDYSVALGRDECDIFQIRKISVNTSGENHGEAIIRSVVQPELALKSPVSYHHKICPLAVTFTDNKYRARSEISASITFDVVVDFKEVPFKFSEDSYRTTLNRNASVLTQVLKTSLPTSIVSDQPFSYEIIRPGADVIASQFGLLMEPNYGVIYVSNSTALRHVTVDTITFTVKVTNGDDSARSDVTIQIVKSETIPDNCEPRQCSTFDRKDECERACGIGSPTGKCVWRENRRSGMHYSTCTPFPATCPNKICDDWERLHPELCLQDCVERSKVSGPIHSDSNQKGARGITMAKGICYCTTSQECFCVPLAPKLSPSSSSTFEAIGVERQATYMEIQNITPNAGKDLEIPVDKVVSIPPACDSDCKTLVSLGVSSGSVIIIVAIITLRYNHRKKRRRSPKKYNAKEVGSNISISAIPSDYLDDTPALVQEVPENWMTGHSRSMKIDYDPKWEFSRSNLLFEKVIGEGEFGRVIRAQALNIRGLTGYTPVAVKMVKHCSSHNELRDLITELTLLKQVNHPNVIKLLGCCTQKGPLYVISEFCQNGSLRNYLRECRRLETLYVQDQYNAEIDGEDSPVEDILTPRDLVSFSWQICKGMQYLADMKLVHRDLASRNVLVAEGKIMKISDFGLTRDIYESDAYLKKSKGRIPVKWMAVESLYDQIYTTKSDVWSFGVLLWEIVTLGATPYPGIPPERLFHILKSGHRMEKPDNCSDEFYDIMLRCWRTRPEERPRFTEIGRFFEQMLEQNREYLDLSSGTSYSDTETDQKDDEEVKVNLISSESEDGSQGRASDESLYGEIKFISLSRSCSDIQVKKENSQMTELPQRPRCHSSAIPCTYNKCNSTDV